MHPFTGHLQPAVKRLILREHFCDDLIGLVDIFRSPAQRDPSEGTFAFAEQRSDVRGHKARKIEGVLRTTFLGFRTRLFP